MNTWLQLLVMGSALQLPATAGFLIDKLGWKPFLVYVGLVVAGVLWVLVPEVVAARRAARRIAPGSGRSRPYRFWFHVSEWREVHPAVRPLALLAGAVFLLMAFGCAVLVFEPGMLIPSLIGVPFFLAAGVLLLVVAVTGRSPDSEPESTSRKPGSFLPSDLLGSDDARPGEAHETEGGGPEID